MADTTPPKRRRRWWVFLIVLALLGGAVGLIWYLSSLGGTPTETVEVPDVVDLTQEEATATLEDAGFEVEVDEEEFFLVPAGIVFEQDPEPGTDRPEGSAVTIVVSTGAGEVEIPDVSGRNVAEATAALAELNLEAQPREEESETVDAGLVIRTEPPAGTRIERGSTVTLVVSRGAGDVEVPDVTGRDVNEAVSILSGAGLVAQQETEPSTTVGNNLVIRTDPPAGTLAQRGSTVVVVVSSGPPTGEVPSVLGQTQAEAEAAVSAAGFVPRSQLVESSPENDGRVVNQNPTGGTTAQFGTDVVLQIGEAPPSTTSTTTTTGP